jgi:hypothetical protein
VDTVWLDVQMWTPLRGNFHPFLDVVCEAPDPAPAVEGEWRQWASAHLAAAAEHEQWQPGRYHYTAELRDDNGRQVEVKVRGIWEWAD